MSEPCAELRQRIAAKIDEKMHSERMEDHFEGQDYADAVMELFADWTLDEGYQYGTEKRMVWVGPWEPVLNDIEATGHCCCAGCIGMGPCDLDLGQSDDEWTFHSNVWENDDD